ncbi:ImmA/IrrE family metallo-endopeptidase [Verrucomicrobium sp. BvORR106]|uniref:ImmA/IrrE family metallo-endopeptidase n=1 Tax=Verrucomicrobium sp. BvORR106 TaxID=1403819 RepID=UPI00056DABE7|nr:ImmA/IrrE family metallo-endopeptidase [Verrucomicrobium sp. BvORR106]
MKPQDASLTMVDEDVARSLLDQLLEDSKLYKTSTDYFELLEFTKRLRNFAPFNAMLLHVQKPGLRYAASAYDWKERFGRSPKENARPLLILWPFGPVALVYDVQDTEGKDLPIDVDTFFARGAITAKQLSGVIEKMNRRNIDCTFFDGGDGNAGSIRVEKAPTTKEGGLYSMQLNRNHNAPVQFVTIAHELAHLFLGHLGPDRKLNIPERPRPDHAKEELEAESVAYLVCGRNGVESKSQAYLTHFVEANTTVDSLDLYQVMRAAGQIETLLGLASHTRYQKPNTLA